MPCSWADFVGSLAAGEPQLCRLSAAPHSRTLPASHEVSGQPHRPEEALIFFGLTPPAAWPGPTSRACNVASRVQPFTLLPTSRMAITPLRGWTLLKAR